MNIINADVTHYDTLLQMYRSFLEEAYPTREVQSNYFLTKAINAWLESSVDLVVAMKDDKVVGFQLNYVDTQGGILSPVYRSEITYVLPKYRKTKVSYELLKYPVKLAEANKMTLVSKATMHNKVNKLHKKLGGEPVFIEMEKRND